MRAGSIVSRSAACLALAVSILWACLLAGPAQAAELYRITGRVTTGQDKPLPGVIVRFSNGLPTAVTDQEGRYVAIVPAGVQRYTVTPQIGGYTFEPGQARVWISGDDAEADFRAVLAPEAKPRDSQVGVLDVYNYIPLPRGTEQIGAISSSSTTLNPGHQFFRVYLQAGKKYAFETYPAATTPQCSDTIMSLCQSWSPTKGPSAIRATADDSYDRDDNYSTIVYAPASNGYYYLWIHGFAGATGYFAFRYDYAFTYRDLSLNTTVRGCVNDSALATCPGHAFYRVWLTSGTTYTIETSAATAAPRCVDTVLSLASRFSALVGPYNEVASDDDSGADLYSRLLYRPTVTRAYYIHVRGGYGDGGYFNLRVSPSLIK